MKELLKRMKLYFKNDKKLTLLLYGLIVWSIFILILDWINSNITLFLTILFVGYFLLSLINSESEELRLKIKHLEDKLFKN
ncbi:hypothetical protein ACFLZ0_01225 [Patescibacteria group bacterium]